MVGCIIEKNEGQVVSSSHLSAWQVPCSCWNRDEGIRVSIQTLLKKGAVNDWGEAARLA